MRTNKQAPGSYLKLLIDKVNRIISEIKIGDMNNLNTTNKETIVDAINEVHSSVESLGDQVTYSLSGTTLTITTKTETTA